MVGTVNIVEAQQQPVTPGGGIVTVNLNEQGLWVCQYGDIGTPNSTMHSPGGNGRPCIHSPDMPPHLMLFGIEWVNRLLWQPALYTDWHPVIASRRGGEVALAFDVIGPTKDCKHRPTKIVASNRFVYNMFPMRWRDDEPVWHMAWLGVRA